MINLFYVFHVLKVNETEQLKSNDVKLLLQEISTMNHYIRRVLESTKSNTFDYNVSLLFNTLFLVVV